MKKKWIRLAIPLSVLAFVGWAWAQSTPNPYTCTTTTVSSSSSPVAIMTPARLTTWTIHVQSTPAADPVLVFPYVGNTVPSAVPSPEAAMERVSGSDWSDAVTCNAPNCSSNVGEGWAAVLESGSTATKVTTCTR